jgi:signal peptidase II
MRAERGLRLGFVLAGLVLAADVVTKAAIVAWVEYGSSHEWLPLLNIVHLLNRGAAFSFLHDANGWQRLFFILIALAASVFLICMIRRSGTSPGLRSSVALWPTWSTASCVGPWWTGSTSTWDRITGQRSTWRMSVSPLARR